MCSKGHFVGGMFRRVGRYVEGLYVMFCTSAIQMSVRLSSNNRLYLIISYFFEKHFIRKPVAVRLGDFEIRVEEETRILTNTT
jgi:hypothetical protein